MMSSIKLSNNKYLNKHYLNNENISSIFKIIQKNPSIAIAILQRLSINKLVCIFKMLDLNLQKKIVTKLSTFRVAELINQLAIDDRVSFLEKLDKNGMKDMIKYLSGEEKKYTLISLGYPEYSVGRLMTYNYISVYDTWDVGSVLSYIRSEGKSSDAIEVIYIINKKGQLVDDIKIGEFLLVNPTTKVRDLMDGFYISLNVTYTEEEAIKIFNINNRVVLPVIDHSNILLGIVTIDDILWVLNENYSEDIQKMGGMEVLDQPYLDVPLINLIKKRAGWLILLFLGEMFTSTAMQYFSSTIEKAVVLSLFIPLVVSSGGNSGSQAASLIIQAMALGDVTLKNWLDVLFREIICGLCLGFILGFFGFIRILIWQNFHFYNYGQYWLYVATSVCISLIGIVFWGSLSGSMLPMIIKRFGGDPATSSAPFVATLVDVTGIVIYFFISYIILKGNLL
jgi:magnesium transporter